MTRHEVEKEMMQYRTIFPIVRLLDAGQVCGNAPVGEHCPCHEFWHRDAPCQNCISRQVIDVYKRQVLFFALINGFSELLDKLDDANYLLREITNNQSNASAMKVAEVTAQNGGVRPAYISSISGAWTCPKCGAKNPDYVGTCG